MPEVIILPFFKKQLRPYAKKYRSLKKSLIENLNYFDKNNNIYLGQNLYKLRLRTKGLNKGKSGSFRVIILLVELKDFVVPVAIYAKSDKSNMSKKEIFYYLKRIEFELYFKI
jgi:hypothetical protein